VKFSQIVPDSQVKKDFNFDIFNSKQASLTLPPSTIPPSFTGGGGSHAKQPG